MPVGDLVIDSGPLLAVLLGDFMKRMAMSPDEQKGVLDRVLPPLSHDQDLLEILMLGYERTARVLTTPHVVAELNSLVSKRAALRGPRLMGFWDSVFSGPRLMRLEEAHHLTLAQVADTPTVRKWSQIAGVTDACLIELARSLGCKLLTNDERTLAPLAWEHGVDCVLFEGIETSGIL